MQSLGWPQSLCPSENRSSRQHLYNCPISAWPSWPHSARKISAASSAEVSPPPLQRSKMQSSMTSLCKASVESPRYFLQVLACFSLSSCEHSMRLSPCPFKEPATCQTKLQSLWKGPTWQRSKTKMDQPAIQRDFQRSKLHHCDSNPDGLFAKCLFPKAVEIRVLPGARLLANSFLTCPFFKKKIKVA